MIPTQQLDEWKRLADAATPMPWQWQSVEGYVGLLAPADLNVHPYELRSVMELGVEYGPQEKPRMTSRKEDEDFIAAARSAVPALLDAVRELQQRCDQLTDDNRLLQTELAAAMDQIHSEWG